LAASPPLARPKPRRKVDWTARRWILLRQVVQYLALLVFVALFVWSRRGGWPANLVNLPMRLDPLATLAHLLASRALLAGSALALITVALTLVFGRAWCGWLCPLGTLLDLFSLRRWRGKREAPADSWRKVKYGLLLTILAAALFTNLTLLIFDPLTILFRTLSASVWPALDQVVTGAEMALYPIPLLRSPLSAFDGLVRPTVLPSEPAF
jgi:polyferredoxin